jgi:ParB-like chromosome segregation protein Spo0J
MADIKTSADSRTALGWFKPDRIKVKAGLNGRDLTTPDNIAHIEEIAASIEANGFMQSKPLEIFSEGEDWYLSDGHCRLAAVQLCLSRGVAVEKVPCVAEPRGTNDVDRILNQDAHNSSKRLTALELGGNIKRAMGLGALSVAEVARRMGKSVTYVNQALDFQAAPAEVHALVKSGAVSATFAAKQVRKEGGAKATETLKAAVETSQGRGKVRATEKDIAGPRANLKAPWTPAPKRALYTEADLTSQLAYALRQLLRLCEHAYANAESAFERALESESSVIAARAALARAEEG